MTSSDVPSSAGRAAAVGAATIVFSRVVSFALSQITLRCVRDVSVLGRASVQLELLLSTVLFLGREGLRLAALRRPATSDDDDDDDQAVTNVVWCAAPIGWCLSVAAWFVHRRRRGDAEDEDYALAGALYCLAAAIESTAEPFVAHALRRTDLSSRAAGEGAGALVKAAATVSLLRLSSSDLARERPVAVFGVARCCQAVVYVVVVVSRTRRVTPSPSFETVGPLLDRPTLRWAALFSAQGVFKHLLTEGDRVVLTWTADDRDQGVYAVASAYGGLASRTLLQPLEESARALLARADAAGDAAATERVYGTLVRLVVYVGLVFACLAPRYTHVLLTLLAGNRRAAETSEALSAFCVYTAVSALNGTTEAFCYAAAREVRSLTIVHAVVGVVFALVAPPLVKARGAVGIVAANALAMALRSAWSIAFAAGRFAETTTTTNAKQRRGRVAAVLVRLLRRIAPEPAVLVCFLSSFLVTGRSERWFAPGDRASWTADWARAAAAHVGCGVACAAITAATAYRTEKTFGRDLRALVTEARTKTKTE